jgi:hypothetical protein
MTSQTPDMQTVLERLKLERQNLTIERVGVLVLAAVGYVVLVGKQYATDPLKQSKFAEYQRAATVSAMDWALLKAEVSTHELRLRERAQGDVGTPAFHYDKGKDRILADVFVSPAFVERQSLDTIRKRFEDEGMLAFVAVADEFPEGFIQSRDIEVNFNFYRASEPSRFYTVASYYDRKLTMH